MTMERKVERRKLFLLELTREMGNVDKARKMMGYSRQKFYRVTYRRGG